MRAVFVMLKVEPGHVHQVAAEIAELPSYSEAYSISGQYDLLVKLYIETLDDLDRLVTEEIHRLKYIRETFTILTFGAFTVAGGE
ncbi:MAG: Lrp/AsnC family transcriptional regulator [Dehalococcoidia bacterium]